MKQKALFSSIACASLLCGFTESHAAVILNLFDYAYNIDGAITAAPGAPPGNVNDSAFNYSTGLGTIVVSFNSPGSHFAGLFVDHEIDEGTNTFFNEFGSVGGTAPAGWSWEIDEPGFVFGDIYSHFTSSDATGSLLDNSNGVPSGSPDDVSMALGWNFSLAAGESAVVSFSLSPTAPTGGFFLQHTDPDSDSTLYLSGRSTINDSGHGVPEGMNTGLALCFVSMLGHFCRRWSAGKGAGAASPNATRV